jgi:predicted metallo-beta-lactamase superfamily hydrolase
MTASTPISKELSVRQEKKLLEDVRSDLVLAVFKLGDSRFTKLMKMIDDAAMEADREAIAASDLINDRV